MKFPITSMDRTRKVSTITRSTTIISGHRPINGSHQRTLWPISSILEIEIRVNPFQRVKRPHRKVKETIEEKHVLKRDLHMQWLDDGYEEELYRDQRIIRGKS